MVENRLQAAVKLFENGLYSEAEDIFRSILKEDKESFEAHFYLGYIHFKRDEYDQAVDMLNKAVKLNDKDARVYEVLGQALGFKAQHAGMVKGTMLLPKVKKAFEKALEINPDSLTAKEGLYMFYLFVPSVAGGDDKKAREFAEEIKKLNPARGYLAEALYMSKLQKQEDAEQLFEKAAMEGKDDPEIQHKAGQFFLEIKKFDKAGQSFDRFLALQPDNPAAYTAKGDYFAATGQDEQAVSMYNRALDKNKDFFPARFKRAQIRQKKGETEKAKEDYRFIVEHYSKSPLVVRAKQALSKL